MRTTLSLASLSRIFKRLMPAPGSVPQSVSGDIGARTTVIPFSYRPAATPEQPIAEFRTSGAFFIGAGCAILLLSLVAVLAGQRGVFGAGGLLLLLGGIWRSSTPLVRQFHDRLVVRVSLERAPRTIPLDDLDAAAVSDRCITLIVGSVEGEQRQVLVPLGGLSARDRLALCRLVDQHARLPIAA